MQQGQNMMQFHFDKQQALAVLYGYELPDMQHGMQQVWKTPEWIAAISLLSMRENLHART
jgi:hypothetical protein